MASAPGAVELQETGNAQAPPHEAHPPVASTSAGAGDNYDDNPPEAARSYFADKSIFQKRPAVRRYDAVWQARAHSTQGEAVPFVQSCVSLMMFLHLSPWPHNRKSLSACSSTVPGGCTRLAGSPASRSRAISRGLSSLITGCGYRRALSSSVHPLLLPTSVVYEACAARRREESAQGGARSCLLASLSREVTHHASLPRKSTGLLTATRIIPPSGNRCLRVGGGCLPSGRQASGPS